MAAPCCPSPRPLAARPAHLQVPDYGLGAGLRVPHYSYLLKQEPECAFFEIITENFLGRGGKPLFHLDTFRERFPLVLHGVSLSIGSPDGLDWDYLTLVKQLVRRVKPAWVTDHLCFTGGGGLHLHDLLPVPFTSFFARLIAERTRQVQDFLEVPFGLENTSSYLSYQASTQPEWEFVSEVLERADCGLLLDVNNIYVSATNQGYNPLDYLRQIPHERVLQIHVAGHTRREKFLLDTHRGPVPQPVLELYQEATHLCGPRATLLEWDDQIPEFPRIEEELRVLQTLRDQALTPSFMPRATLSSSDTLVAEQGDSPWFHGGPAHPSSLSTEPKPSPPELTSLLTPPHSDCHEG